MKRLLAQPLLRRRWLWALIGLAGLVASVGANRSKQEVAPVEPSVVAKRTASGVGSDDRRVREEAAMLEQLAHIQLTRPQATSIAVDPFMEPMQPKPEPSPAPPVVRKTPPKPKPVVQVAETVQPPPPPTPPALPYRYVGRLVESGNVPLVFLAKGEDGFAARTGDTIDGTYRVAEVLPREIVFVYLPLDQRQRLVIHE